MGETPIMGYPYSRLGVVEMGPLIPNDWSVSYGRAWGNRGHATANPGDPPAPPLSANKDTSFLAHLADQLSG